MVPELGLQLQVVIKALKDTVAPALDPNHRMAVEQLGLSIATLSMVRERLPLASLREWQDLANAVALGHAAAPNASSDLLEKALLNGEALLDEARPAVSARPAATKEILALVSSAVREAQGADATALMRSVLDASRPMTDLARAWGKSAGFEPDPSEVPDLTTLLAATASIATTGVV